MFRYPVAAFFAVFFAFGPRLVQAQCDAGDLPETLQICSVESVDLNTLFTGPFDESGFWIKPDNSVLQGSVFNPLIDPAGVYAYRVSGPGCADTAFVEVQTNDQGILGDFFSCSLNPFFLQSVTQINLPNGTIWYEPTGTALVNGWVNPAENPPGIYTGVYQDQNGCAVFAHADLDFPNTLTRQTLIELNICPTIPLNFWIMELLGSHAVNYVGHWNYSNLSGTETEYLGQAFEVFYNTANDPDGYYIYTYVAPGCNQTTSDTLLIQSGTNVSVGSDGSLVTCQSGDVVNLTSYLEGNPTPDLTWFNANGEEISEDFSLLNDTVATFYYTDPGNLCADTAYLSVNVTLSEISTGVATSVSFCNSDDAVFLIDLLNGNPDPTGFFTNPDDEVVTVFDPTSDEAGDYFYHIDNECGTVSVKLRILVYGTPNPGMDTEVSLCPEDAGIVNLLAMLDGSPASGGNFYTPGGNMLFGTIVNLGNYTGGDFTYEIAYGTCVRTAVLSIEYFDSPVVDLGADTTICDGDEITLNAGPGVSFNWSTGDSGPLIPVSSEGFYSVTVTDGHGCQGSDGIYLSIEDCETGVFEKDATALSIYPNPAKNSIHLSVPVSDAIKVEILSMTGQKVFATQIDPEGEGWIELPADIPAGLYNVVVSAEVYHYQEKLVIVD